MCYKYKHVYSDMCYKYITRITYHSFKLIVAYACRNMSLKIGVRFFQYLSSLLLLRSFGNFKSNCWFCDFNTLAVG